MAIFDQSPSGIIPTRAALEMIPRGYVLKLSIVIPVYNERTLIPRLLERVLAGQSARHDPGLHEPGYGCGVPLAGLSSKSPCELAAQQVSELSEFFVPGAS